MMTQVLQMKDQGLEIPKVTAPEDIKANIAKSAKPPKQEMIDKHRSRFADK